MIIMTNYGIVNSFTRPKSIEVTNTTVYIASNIKPYTDDNGVEGFKYNYVGYTKDEYIEYLHDALVDTQLALLEVMGDED